MGSPMAGTLRQIQERKAEQEVPLHRSQENREVSCHVVDE